MPVCSICSHPHRTEIERGLVAKVPLRKLVEEYGTSIAAMSRHRTNCVSEAIARVRKVREEVLAEHDETTREVLREAVTEQVRNGTLLTTITVEKEIARLFERVNKLYDACDTFLESPTMPGEYTLDARAAEIQIVWEELEEETLEGEKPKWIKVSGSLQEALAKAFSNGHRRFVKNNPIKFADPRELILKVAGELRQTVDLLAKLEGRYRPVEKELNQGDTIQMNLVINILNAHGFKL